MLYIYSLELGTPPLYTELNRVTRDMYTKYLLTLGPYAMAIGQITYSAEWKRDDSDRITTGIIMGGEVYNMRGAFLLFQGVQMEDEWLQPYH